MERFIPTLALGLFIASTPIAPSILAQEVSPHPISTEAPDQPIINDRSNMIRVVCLPVGQRFHVYIDKEHIVVNDTTFEHEGNYAIVCGDPDTG